MVKPSGITIASARVLQVRSINVNTFVLWLGAMLSSAAQNEVIPKPDFIVLQI